MKRSTRNTIIELAIVVTLFIAVTVTCKPTHAADKNGTELVITAVSHHIVEGTFNEVNPGLGVFHHVSDDTALVAGTYMNSFHRRTVYVGGSSHIVGRGRVQLRVDLLLATGYQNTVIPVATPVIEVVTSKITSRIVIIPNLNGDAIDALGLQFRVKL